MQKLSVTSLVPGVMLLAALVYTQVGWRSDRKVFMNLKDSHAKLLAQTGFLATGDVVADRTVPLLKGADTVLLSRVVLGKNSLVYFEKKGCAVCDWFKAQMDSINPQWKDSMVIVSATSHLDSLRGQYMLPEESLRQLPGVPTLLVVDSAGLVVHAAVGAKRMLAVLEHIGVRAPTVGQLLQAK